MRLRLVQLDKEDYEGKELHFEYTTDRYYEVSYREDSSGWQITFTERRFDSPVSYSFSESMYQPYMINPLAYAVELGERPVGWLMLRRDYGSGRARIDELLVERPYRGRGIGTLLVKTALAAARRDRMRQVIVETQNHNFPAVQFYRAQGFVFTGCDLTCYSNQDLARQQVRLELAHHLGPDSELSVRLPERRQSIRQTF